MEEYKLTENEEKLIEKYQISKDEDIALYFFNKMGQDILNIVYSKISVKFTSIPLEKNDLMSFVWNSLKKGLNLYKKEKQSLRGIWIWSSYYDCLKEIQKFFKNSELILNYADSWEVYSNTHCVYRTARNSVDMPKQSFKDLLEPIINYVSSHNTRYTKEGIKKLLYLKSLGYSEREIAKKMNVSRRYITSMIKIVLRISKRYLGTSNR